MSVEATDDPGKALAHAGPFLARRPVDTNVLLSILNERIAHPEPGHYWTATSGAEVVGFGLQSPVTFCAGLSPMASATAGELAGAVFDQVGHIPGVIGDAATAASFAGRWSELAGGQVTPEEGQRIYRLGNLRPVTGVPGKLRVADWAERDLLVSWRQSFNADTASGGIGDPEAAVDRDLDGGRLFVWDDGGPCCSARASLPLAGVCRIGIVYTPPERRRRGYAAVCVGALSARVRKDDGAQCMLYTQLANSTSNGIYRRLGYEAVAEVLRYRFQIAG